jgi:ATP-dependent DNA helicase RecQ
MNCTGTPLSLDPDPSLVARAEEFLRTRELTLEPRRMWPPSFPERTGRIPAELQLEPGRALCVEGDGGWGQLVRAGREGGREFSPELVAAAARLIRRWNPDPFPI